MGNFVSPALVSPSSYTITQWTIGQICTQALRLAGALKLAGQQPSPSEQQEALDVLDHWIDGIKIENLMIEFLIQTDFAVTINKSIYGVGPGEDWDIERPEKINSAGFVLNKGTQTEAELPMFVATTYQQWQAMIAKNITSTLPLWLYYQPTPGVGSATIWPVPSLNSVSDNGAYVRLYTPGYLQEFLTWDDQVITPKGYREMIMYNLAVAIHERPPYNTRPMSPRTERMAQFTKDRVMAQQMTPVLAYPDEASLSDTRAGRAQGHPRAWTPYT